MTPTLASVADTPPPALTPEGVMTRFKAMTPDERAAMLADDPVRAAPWVRAAALHGLPEAQVRWGRMLLEGEGVARDPDKALLWFRRAADAGDVEAINMVGRCLENGWGAPASSAAAAPWYARAAEAGDAWARYNLAHLYLDGNGVGQDRSRARALYRQAAEAGHVRAMNSAGRCLEEGWGVSRDPATARDWYRRSAEGGYFRGQFNFATVLAAAGEIEAAQSWFEQALAGATPPSRAAMQARLAGHPDPRLAALGVNAICCSASIRPSAKSAARSPTITGPPSR